MATAPALRLIPELPAPLYLASRSPRRRDLLARLGVPYTVRPADIDEMLDPELDAQANARELAMQKARAVAADLEVGWVLGADTIVVIGGEVLGKPEDAADAERMFSSLTGRTHTVVTGLALVDALSGEAIADSVATKVTLRSASPAEAAAYVATGEPLDKAGAYGAQALGAVFIERVEGCYYNVVGLPVARLYRMLVTFLAETRVG